ncbi:MAG: prolyl oligopeptidase family serine peptidase [Gammaproteobacteria bacterium]|nr:prolyl oligopeptidase family serine peptidase [Gammaproteobacteria bacterium]
MCTFPIRLVFMALVILLAACEIPPRHAAVAKAQLPPLIPVRDFVANTDYLDNFAVSPDGTKLAWNGVRYLRSAILWRDLQSGDVQALRFTKNAPTPFWAANSQHILYHFDADGSERHQVHALDVATGEVRDLTPYAGVKAFVIRVPEMVSDEVFLMHNRRDSQVFDIYRVNVRTGAQALVYENKEAVINSLVDDTGVLRVRVRQTGGERLLETVDANAGGWRSLLRADRFSAMWPIDLDSSGRHVYVSTDVGRDKRALESVDLRTGRRTLLFAHPRADIARVVLSPKDRRPLLVTMQPDYPARHFFDERLARLLTPLLREPPAGLRIMSLSRDETVATAVRYDHTGALFYLLLLDDAKPVLLGESATRAFADKLVEQRAVTIRARDGLDLPGYALTPKSASQSIAESPWPLVLLVHGGPWARDWWGYHMYSQFLANRGYAVLRVNYRGSDGYGRSFKDAAIGEFAGQMHTDLLDAVQWAVARGIADPRRLAIMGGSYGGYATLVGMTMTPGRFACGVDIVGISDLVTAIEDFPPYWKPAMHYWYKFAGRPDAPPQRERMKRQSPLNFAGDMQGALLVLHGENDPRVRNDQSERMVAALKAAGKNVTYHVFANEGHGFRHWKNRMTTLRKVEDFLAGCLGGRSSGFDYYQLGSWAF